MVISISVAEAEEVKLSPPSSPVSSYVPSRRHAEVENNGTEDSVDDWLMEAEITNLHQNMENSDLKQLVEQARKVARMAAMASSRYEVVVEDKTPAMSLCIDIEKRPRTLVIKRVRDGPLAEWSRQNPERAVRPGDHVVVVNGCAGSADELCRVVGACQGRLELGFLRAPNDEQAKRKRREARTMLNSAKEQINKEVSKRLATPAESLPKTHKDWNKYLQPPPPERRPSRRKRKEAMLRMAQSETGSMYSEGVVSESLRQPLPPVPESPSVSYSGTSPTFGTSLNTSPSRSSGTHSSLASPLAGGLAFPSSPSGGGHLPFPSSPSGAGPLPRAAPKLEKREDVEAQANMKLAAMAPTAAAVAAAIMHPKFDKLRQGAQESDLLKLAEEVRKAVEESLEEELGPKVATSPVCPCGRFEFEEGDMFCRKCGSKRPEVQDEESVRILAESVALALTADTEDEPAALLSDLILAEAALRRKEKAGTASNASVAGGQAKTRQAEAEARTAKRGAGDSFDSPQTAFSTRGQAKDVQAHGSLGQQVPDSPSGTFSSRFLQEPEVVPSYAERSLVDEIAERSPEREDLTRIGEEGFSGRAAHTDPMITASSGFYSKQSYSHASSLQVTNESWFPQPAPAPLAEDGDEQLEEMMREWLNVHCAEALQEGSTTSDVPEIEWLAKCMSTMKLPDDARQEDSEAKGGICQPAEEGVAPTPLYKRFVHMGRLAILARQQPGKAKAAGLRLAKLRDDALFDAFQLQDEWAGPFPDEETGMEYYHNYASGESTWTMPSQAPLYLAWIADRLLRGGLFPEETVRKAGDLKDVGPGTDGQQKMLMASPLAHGEEATLGMGMF